MLVAKKYQNNFRIKLKAASVLKTSENGKLVLLSKTPQLTEKKETKQMHDTMEKR